MNMHRILPWRYIVKRFALGRGFIDPVKLYARLQRFAQPSEVAEPVELLRAGAVFHARGLINSRVLQHNLDWVWPYWVQRQFDPVDVSFLPRAFSLTHVNLTHRNWTGIGLPGREEIPIVDPRGLLTPFWDSWSIDVWCMDDNDKKLLPSRSKNARQWQALNNTLSVNTHIEESGIQLEMKAEVVEASDGDVCNMSIRGAIPDGGWLVISARPCNPEGISFIDNIGLSKDRYSWKINKDKRVFFDQKVEIHHASDYQNADVFVHLRDREEQQSVKCDVGLATAAALFRMDARSDREVVLSIPLSDLKPNDSRLHGQSSLKTDWSTALQGAAAFSVPDKRICSIYKAALNTLILCTPGDVYAGPYTYKRYWYRDAAYIGHGLLCAGLLDRAKYIVEHFPDRQDRSGYYHSQEGEWDSNGEVLWLIDRYRQFSGSSMSENLFESLQAGANWIAEKCTKEFTGKAHEGLLPAGFSAEHLGPNDHYYWDNYWSVAGLDSAARIADSLGQQQSAGVNRQRSNQLQAAITRSLERMSNRADMPAIPAAPGRRLDAGAIGSIVASYPLQICAPGDKSLLGTIDFLLKDCAYRDAFFQDMIHSGVNAYLTLQIAQALLRADDQRFQALIRSIASFASPTGHWPEAIHPHTEGGCMGDGHHAWAAAEWVCMMRYCFIREEEGELILGSGLLPEWLDSGESLFFGPAPTLFGTMSITIPEFDLNANSIEVKWEAAWHDAAPPLELRIPGFSVVKVKQPDMSGSIVCKRIIE